MNLNKVQLIGRITRDIETKALPSGQLVASFSMATNRYYKDGKTGEKKEEVEFHNLTAFGKSAETIGQYVRKGSMLYVEGRLQTRSWEDKDTQKKMYRTEVIIDTFQLPPRSMGGGESQEDERDVASGQRHTATKPASKRTQAVREAAGMDTVEYPDEDINPDDIPF